MFDAIAKSNGWNDDITAFQLFVHLIASGTSKATSKASLDVASLVPEAIRDTRDGLVGALNDHFGSPGRLVDCRRRFERTVRRDGEDPSVFATALETLAVRVFGDMSPKA